MDTLADSAKAPERISEAEHAVMEVLWRRSPRNAAQVCDHLCAARDWSIPTVKTLLARLVAKGALATRPDGRRFLYTPLLERSDYVGTEIRRLVDRLFGGRAAPLLVHLVQSEPLSPQDIAEIERLLAELKK